jgi:hypothetical protein
MRVGAYADVGTTIVGPPINQSNLGGLCCSSPFALLAACCGWCQAKATASKDVNGSVTFSFFAVLLSELLSSVAKVTDDHLRPLLPYLLHGAKSTSSPDYQARRVLVYARVVCVPRRRLSLSSQWVLPQLVHSFDRVAMWSDCDSFIPH